MRDPVMAVLADMLEFVLSMINSHECKCKVDESGLNMCERCCLLRKAGRK